MNTYNPDVWKVIKVIDPDAPSRYRVLGGWYGGYSDGDSWQLSSGIVKCVEHEYYYEFTNISGSVYNCHKACERTSLLTGSLLLAWAEGMEAVGGQVITLDIEGGDKVELDNVQI